MNGDVIRTMLETALRFGDPVTIAAHIDDIAKARAEQAVKAALTPKPLLHQGPMR